MIQPHNFSRNFLLILAAALVLLSSNLNISAQPDHSIDPSIELNATIIITTTTDAASVDGACSLREAIVAANTDTPVDVCAAGSGSDTILLTSLSGTMTLVGTLPTLTTPMNIEGPGAALLTL